MVLASYSYIGSANQENIYSVLIILNLFISSILLLNFMIAILSTTYGQLLESGSFKYKCQLFQYCEIYLTAMKEPCFGEMVIHPAPLNVFASLMIPFVPFNVKSKRDDTFLMQKISQMFSKGIFWVENILFIAIFVLAEIIMFPLVVFKSFVNMAFFTKKLELKQAIAYFF